MVTKLGDLKAGQKFVFEDQKINKRTEEFVIMNQNSDYLVKPKDKTYHLFIYNLTHNYIACRSVKAHVIPIDGIKLPAVRPNLREIASPTEMSTFRTGFVVDYGLMWSWFRKKERMEKKLPWIAKNFGKNPRVHDCSKEPISRPADKRHFIR